MPARDGDERDRLGVVANLLDKVGNFLDDFFVALLRVLVGVHLVDGDNQLLHAQRKGQQGVLAGLAVLGDTGFELADTTSNNQDGAISLQELSVLFTKNEKTCQEAQTARPETESSCGRAEITYLRRAGNHVLDEITMARGVNDGDVVPGRVRTIPERENLLGGLELPQGNVDGNTTFTLGLQLVQNPGVLERALAHFGGFLLELRGARVR